MATDVASDERVVQPQPPEPRRPSQRLYSTRFLVVYGVLALATAGAVAGLVVGLTRAGVGGGGPAWSAWKPSGGGLGAAKQIADHLSKTYRLPNGDQLVDVITKSPSVSPASGETIPLHFAVIQGQKGAANEQFSLSSSNSVMYSLCGLGTSCSIATGAPTVARGTLVRREILELALYTFKYVGGMKYVIAFMPPAPGSSAQYVVYLQKSELSPYLKAPLAQTLSAHVPLPSTIPAREVHVIDATTEANVFKFSLAQAQTGDAVLVLTPLSA
jgi:hypothetical protein